MNHAKCTPSSTHATWDKGVPWHTDCTLFRLANVFSVWVEEKGRQKHARSRTDRQTCRVCFRSRIGEHPASPRCVDVACCASHPVPARKSIRFSVSFNDVHATWDKGVPWHTDCTLFRLANVFSVWVKEKGRQKHARSRTDRQTCRVCFRSRIGEHPALPRCVDVASCASHPVPARISIRFSVSFNDVHVTSVPTHRNRSSMYQGVLYVRTIETFLGVLSCISRSICIPGKRGTGLAFFNTFLPGPR